MSEPPVILVIDDVIENVAVLGAAFSEVAEVQFATSGQEGLELARRTVPDLILLDVMMPDMDGFQVCEHLQREDATRAIPVIFVTARTDAASESRGLALGAVDFIHKPLRPDLVQARVRLHLELARRARALQAANQALEDKVAQRTQDLMDALQRAEGAARSKTDFLARMSHELRTPLNAVIGLAQVGLRDEAAGRATHSLYPRILSAGQHLLRVVSDVLDFSRIEAGKCTVESRPFDLAATVAQAAQMLEPQALEQGISLQVDCSPGPRPRVMGDAQRIQQVLVNLLSNAVKFTERGQVRLRVSSEAARHVFEVTDTGIGLTPDQISRLFQPFEQADSSSTRRQGGTGLGLVISRHLAREMGGDITVRSVPGQGSTFTFTVTLPEAPTRDTEPGALIGGTGRLQGLRVLAAEDMEVNRFLLARILEQEDARVQFAEDGAAAVQAVQDQVRPAAAGATKAAPFDIVLMDLQMPVMDGFEATRRIREIQPALPVLGLTAHALPEEQARCHAAGMVGHVAKPVDVEELVRAIQRACGPRVRGVAPKPPPAAAAVGAVTTAPFLPGPSLPGPLPAPSPSLSPSPASLNPSAPVIDWAAVAAGLGASDAFLDQLAQGLIKNLGPKPATLRSAVQQRDLPLIMREAHSIKGVAGNVKADTAFALARAVETAARQGQQECLEQAMALADAVEKMLEAAQQRVAGAGGPR
jgi:signal transduction histidine kinase/HPt (histidine-containing phosphotransfer) domain-containing protein